MCKGGGKIDTNTCIGTVHAGSFGFVQFSSLVGELKTMILRHYGNDFDLQEPNYAQEFKFLEDKTMDGSDCLYCCIWDMANPEFVMSLRNKIVEAARWRKALQCTWQLGLKTKNEEEIIHEASDVRKSIEVVLTALFVRLWFWFQEQNQNQTLRLYFINLFLFVWLGCDTEEQTEPEPFKYNLALVLFLVLFDH